MEYVINTISPKHYAIHYNAEDICICSFLGENNGSSVKSCLRFASQVLIDQIVANITTVWKYRKIVNARDM